jgi:hypothetical protein
MREQQLYEQFDLLVRDVNALPPTMKDQKEELLSKLWWLRTQSLCDVDHRAKQSELRECWGRIEYLFNETEFREVYPRPDSFWLSIHDFVGRGLFEIRTNRPSPFANSNVVEMLSHMRNQVSNFGPMPKERRMLRQDLDWLIKQAMLPGYDRNQLEIKARWIRIHRYLTMFGLLRPFKAEPMQTKMMTFLKGDTSLFDLHMSS